MNMKYMKVNNYEKNDLSTMFKCLKCSDYVNALRAKDTFLY